MKRIAVFPGSFDPITIGHVDIINRSLLLFDEIIVAIGENSSKSCLFPLQKRKEWISSVFEGEPKVGISVYNGLTADFCREQGAAFLVRGLRSASDFDYERTIAQLNLQLDNSIDTTFLISRPEHSHISSTIVREILKNKGNAELFLPGKVATKISNFLSGQ